MAGAGLYSPVVALMSPSCHITAINIRSSCRSDTLLKQYVLWDLSPHPKGPGRENGSLRNGDVTPEAQRQFLLNGQQCFYICTIKVSNFYTFGLPVHLPLDLTVITRKLNVFSKSTTHAQSCSKP